MKTKTSLARRNFLRSSTALIALPFLESFGFRRFASAATQSTIPKRMVFLGIGFGVTQETWLPKLVDTGSGYTLPEGLAPLKEHKADFSIVQNTTNKHSAEAHWGSTYWLTRVVVQFAPSFLIWFKVRLFWLKSSIRHATYWTKSRVSDSLPENDSADPNETIRSQYFFSSYYFEKYLEVMRPLRIRNFHYIQSLTHALW